MNFETLIGQTVADRFLIKRVIGRGGYGAVFEAVQVSVGRKCALKVLLPSVAADEATRKRFEHEARLTSQLSHPNTVVIYDFGFDDERDFLFLAMEYIEGESVDELLGKRGPFSVTDALHICRQVAQSLQQAHQLGYVHRDVKPANIMVMEQHGDPYFTKLIDFGIVKAVTGDMPIKSTFLELTKTGMVVGTPAFMSPEQVQDEPLGATSDQYALAATFYKMITGRPPFEGNNPVDVATKHIAMPAPRLRELHPSLSVSAGFEEACVRALAKLPADRYPDTVAFVEAMLHFSDFDSFEAVKKQVAIVAQPEETTSKMQPPVLDKRPEVVTEPALPRNISEELESIDEKIDPYGDTMMASTPTDVERIPIAKPKPETTSVTEVGKPNSDGGVVEARFPDPSKPPQYAEEPTPRYVPAVDPASEIDEANATLIAPKEWPEFEPKPPAPQSDSRLITIGIGLLFAVGIALCGTALWLYLSR